MKSAARKKTLSRSKPNRERATKEEDKLAPKGEEPAYSRAISHIMRQVVWTQISL